MGVVRLGPDGSVEVLDPGTPEEAERAQEALLRLARALGRLAAERDWAAQREAARASSLVSEPEPGQAFSDIRQAGDDGQASRQ